MSKPHASIRVALVGPPNAGKSTVFNSLTGLSQYVSNWAGKTWEEKSGVFFHQGTTAEVLDLPGTYSLTANTTEERAARYALIHEKPDAVVVVIDAVSLERGLYLVAELLSLHVPLVVALNMLDLAEQEGIEIEPHVLEAALGLPVIPMVASRGVGVTELATAAIQAACRPPSAAPSRPEIRTDHQTVLEEVERLIQDLVPEPYLESWAALKLLEGDVQITELMRGCLGPDWKPVETILSEHEDAFLAVASGRYEWIGRMVRAAVVRPKTGRMALTDQLDRLATHPVWGLLILAVILGVLFGLTYAIGAPVQNWMDLSVVQAAVGWTRGWLEPVSPWVAGLAADGIVTGVGTVLTLLPILLIFFAVLGLLEEVGYMARAAYVMDRFMHPMGLHGRSFLPLFLGFGCNVPAVMGTRMIESKKARLVTIMVTPLVPCTARLSVIALLAPIFFGASAFWISWGLIGLSMLALFGVGIALRRWIPGEDQTAFIMELPLYHVPNLHTMAQGLWQRLVDFVKMAGSIILVVSVLMWALSNFPGSSIEYSYLATIGRLLSPVGSLMGLDWQMMVALLASFVRKENTIPTLAVLYGAGQGGIGLGQALSGLSAASGLAFLVVQILFIPCVATLATIRQETRSWGWTTFNLLLLLVLSLAAGVGVYQVARLAGWGMM